MKKIITPALFLFSIIFPSLSFGYEVVEVCATYMGTGKKYKVETRVYSGSELNSKTRSIDYNSFSKYAVIFWGPNEASVIELDFAIAGISPLGSTGRDQRGYAWELTTSTMFCF